MNKSEEFWQKVDMSAGADNCWLWMGGHGGDQYGRVNWQGVVTRAHRVSYTLTFGAIPESKFVCHRCDNPRCCNPAHLFVGSREQNIEDMCSKGRNSPPPISRGERNPAAKLNRDHITEIRKRRVEERLTYAALATEYGISLKQVYRIVKRQSWSHF